MFSISFSDRSLEYPYDDPGVPAAPGSLVLGKCTEDFLANLGIWSKSDYQAHWLSQLKAILEGKLKVALIVSYNNPKGAWYMEVWCVYRDGDWAHFQNEFLQYSELPYEFHVSEIDRYIDDRKVVTEKGERISEWDVHIRDIEVFLQRSAEL